FEALVRRHERLIRSAVGRVLSDPDDADDAFQATFLVLIRRARSIDWRAGLGPWLYGVAHRVAVKARDAGRTRVRKEAGARPAGAEPPPDLSWREACALLHAELDRLPDRYRLPLLLCYLEGKTRDEAAAATAMLADGSAKPPDAPKPAEPGAPPAGKKDAPKAAPFAANVVVQTPDGKPAANADVGVWADRKKQVAGKTDADGRLDLT